MAAVRLRLLNRRGGARGPNIDYFEVHEVHSLGLCLEGKRKYWSVASGPDGGGIIQRFVALDSFQRRGCPRGPMEGRRPMLEREVSQKFPPRSPIGSQRRACPFMQHARMNITGRLAVGQALVCCPSTATVHRPLSVGGMYAPMAASLDRFPPGSLTVDFSRKRHLAPAVGDSDGDTSKRTGWDAGPQK